MSDEKCFVLGVSSKFLTGKAEVEPVIRRLTFAIYSITAWKCLPLWTINTMTIEQPINCWLKCVVKRTNCLHDWQTLDLIR